MAAPVLRQTPYHKIVSPAAVLDTYMVVCVPDLYRSVYSCDGSCQWNLLFVIHLRITMIVLQKHVGLHVRDKGSFSWEIDLRVNTWIRRTLFAVRSSRHASEWDA